MFKSKLFSDQIPPSCAYCKFGFVSQNGRSVLCEKNRMIPVKDIYTHRSNGFRNAPAHCRSLTTRTLSFESGLSGKQNIQ